MYVTQVGAMVYQQLEFDGLAVPGGFHEIMIMIHISMYHCIFNHNTAAINVLALYTRSSQLQLATWSLTQLRGPV